MALRIGIIGVSGRMGRAIGNAAATQGLTVSGGIDRAGAVHGDHPDVPSLAAASDVLIDFSAPAALPRSLATARAATKPIVIGTTGLTRDDHALIDEAARDIAVLQAANTSLGVNLLAHLVREAAARLGPEWDVEIVELHHRHKADAPSGTGLLLGQAAARGLGVELDDVAVRSRDGIIGPRANGAIGFATMRGGTAAGDHHVLFLGDGERVELGHIAENRGIFATGAVKAATWLHGKPAGRYSMRDVLGL